MADDRVPDQPRARRAVRALLVALALLIVLGAIYRGVRVDEAAQAPPPPETAITGIPEAKQEPPPSPGPR